MNTEKNKLRHELKIALNYADYLIVRQRLKSVLPTDPNALSSGEYFIRSVYFDTPNDRALLEKIHGISKREKYRMRFYNMNTDFIRLEKKSKIDNLGTKESAPLTLQEAKELLKGNINFMLHSKHHILQELYTKMSNELLMPKVIVDYNREPFYWRTGNVRITLDKNIKTGTCRNKIFTCQTNTIPVREDVILMEVKYDEFLPEFIMNLIQLNSRRPDAYSKYAACRVFG